MYDCVGEGAELWAVMEQGDMLSRTLSASAGQAARLTFAAVLHASGSAPEAQRWLRQQGADARPPVGVRLCKSQARPAPRDPRRVPLLHS